MPEPFDFNSPDPWDEDFPPLPEAPARKAMPTDFLPDDFDALQQALSETEDRWADLAAVHGNFGKYNDQRKTILAEAKLRTLGQPIPEGAKSWTEDLRDSTARADKIYLGFINDMVDEAKEFHKLDQLRARIKAKCTAVMYSPAR